MRQKPVMDVLDHLQSEEVKHRASKKTGHMLNWSGFPEPLKLGVPLPSQEK